MRQWAMTLGMLAALAVAGTAWAKDCASACVSRCSDEIQSCSEKCPKPSKGGGGKGDLKASQNCMSRCSEKTGECFQQCNSRCGTNQ